MDPAQRNVLRANLPKLDKENETTGTAIEAVKRYRPAGSRR
jgi:hypothetical protein